MRVHLGGTTNERKGKVNLGHSMRTTCCLFYIKHVNSSSNYVIRQQIGNSAVGHGKRGMRLQAVTFALESSGISHYWRSLVCLGESMLNKML